MLARTDVQITAKPLHRLFFWCEGRICSKSAKNRGFVAPMRRCTYKMTIFYLCIGFVEVENTDTLGCQLLSNYLVIPVVTVFCSQILVTLLTFDTVTGKISESKWKVTSK